MKFLVSIICCLMLLFAVSAGADTLYVDKIYNYEVAGDLMDGMIVSVETATGTQSLVWGDTGAADTGGVTGSTWSLLFSGSDTWSPDFFWTLTASSYDPITTLTINAFAGNTAFDILENYKGLPDADGNPISTGNADTEGSQRGWWDGNTYASFFDPLTDATSGTLYRNSYAIDWSFSDDVALTSTSPNSGLGDLYGTLTLTFESGFWDNNEVFQFQLDTDKSTPIPEPATMLLVGLGLFGLAGFGSRVRRAKN